MKKTIKVALLAAGLLATAGSAAALTMAYLTESQSVVNTFTVGDLQLGLKESEWDPQEGDGINVTPGYSVYKNPTIKNVTPDKNGEEPCYARMRIRILDEEGNPVEDEQRLALIRQAIRYDQSYNGGYEKTGSGQAVIQGRIPGYSQKELETLPMINPMFTIDAERSAGAEIVCNYMGSDGDGVLEIGEEAALFTCLAIPTDWGSRELEQAGGFQVHITAEAIQCAGFSGQEEAFQALEQEIAGEEL